MSAQDKTLLQQQDDAYQPSLHCLKGQDSLPSLTNSENTLDENTVYMDTHDTEDINDVLDDVIVKINRITGHLRDVGEYEAANHFTRDTTATLRSLYNVIAPWDIHKCLMQCPEKLPQPKPFEAANPVSQPTVNSWAAVAATKPVIDNNGIIKFRPSDGVKRAVEAHQQQESQFSSRDVRVVWIRPWQENRPLSEISEKMSGLGPIYSIAFAPEEQAVCVILQHSHCATQFMQDFAEHVGRTGCSPFGREHYVVPGLPYPMDNDLRRMEPPHNARRRLTFARSQLFSNGMTECKFRADIESIVGAPNIELLWLFNTGNVTVVFSAVPLARMVRDKFLGYSRTRKHVYEGIMVNYSHDPCERELHLVSQIPGHENFIGSNGKDTAFSGIRPNRSSTISSERSSRKMSANSSDYFSATKCRNTVMKTVVDDEGWQTVQKRR